MAGRIHYLAQRASSVPRALASPTGLAALGATLAGLAALILDSDASPWLAGLSLILWLLAILIVADRLRLVWQGLSHQPVVAETEVLTETRKAQILNAIAVESVRIESARHTLAQIAPEGGASPDGLHGSEPDRGLITVVVPCFNDSRYVVACLESVKNQTFENWECIVVDDASTDDSLRRTWEFTQSDDRFRVVRHTRNSGLSAARNTGLRLATGEYITFLDSDDFLTEDSLADRMLHFVPHSNDPTVAGVYGAATLAPEDALLIDYVTGREWSGTTLDFATSGDRCPFNVHAVVARTSVIRAAGGFTESMRHGAEDWDLWYRVMRNGYRFAPSGLRSAIYRQKSSSMRQRHAIEHQDEAKRLTNAAYTSASGSVVFPDAVAPMLRPRSDYEISTALTRRAIQSAATSLIAGNEAGAVEILSAIDPVHPTVMMSDVEPSEAITDGFRRYLGITPNEYAQVVDRLVPLSEHAMQLVNQHIRVESVESDTSSPAFDLLLLPQTSAQLEQMLAAVATTDLTVGIVDSSAAAGDQGVADYLESDPATSVAILSYNETILSSVTAEAAVVAYPWDAAIDELALSFAERGTVVLRLQNDLDDVLHVSDAPPSRFRTQSITDEALTAACASGDLEPLVRNVDAGPMPTFDTSLLAYRDAADAWTIEEYPDRRFDADDLARFEGSHAGERVVIIGNGPSLNELDLSLLRGTATIGVNGIFYADDRLPEPLTYYVVEDTMVVRDNLERIRQYRAGHRFFPSIYREMIGEGPDTTFFMMNRGFYASTSPAFCIPRFSTDPTQRVYAGQSVTLMNLQLAYFMGFSEVILIGMDFSYSVPESSEINGAHITSMEDDPNHFHPDYFGKGKVWKDPKLDRVLANYALAKQMYEADGRRIVNATPGGNLHLFERVSFTDLFEA